MQKLLGLKEKLEKNLFYILTLVFLMVWYGIFLNKEINLTAVDLGRHLKNGELFFQNFSVPAVNLYSYTYPDFPFINHHWGSGAFFYLIWKVFDFSGLSFFFIFLSLTTFFLSFRLSEKISNFFYTLPIALLAIPLLGERTEVRPEIISCFFSIIFFWILWQWKNGKISNRWLWFLPLLEFFWINSHIYFFMGFLILGTFGLEEIFLERRRMVQLVLVSFFSILAAFINPFGPKGILYPLFIFRNYGYQVVENKSVWFLENLKVFHPSFPFFKIILLILPLSFILLFVFNRKKFSLSLFIISATLLILSGMAIRNFALLGFFVILALSYNLVNLGEKVNLSGLRLKTVSIFLSVIIFAVTFYLNVDNLSNLDQSQIGLSQKVNAAADFFKKEKLHGPIFNNYDIGSYLIYYFYPEEKVFVDNRPEAYPADFFEKVYIPMQENKKDWERNAEKYQFNAIFFYLHDKTPWSQKFLIDRVEDSAWAPVYADNYAIIFLRRNALNNETISRFEIPRKNFSVSQTY